MSASPAGPIFVVGYMHSGTTLLLELLGSHPDVFVSRAETRFFMHLPQLRNRFAISDDAGLEVFTRFCRYVVEHGFPIGRPGEPWLEVEPVPLDLDGPHDHAEVFVRVMWELASRAGARRWLEKTPTHIFHVDEIVAAVDDPCFVEVIRDPRDVLASKKTRRQLVWTDRYAAHLRPRRHLEKAFDPLWDSLSWSSAVKAGDRARELSGHRWSRIRYEDLVADPRVSLEAVCATIGLDLQSIDLEVTRGIPADISLRETEGAGVSTSSVGRYRNVLLEREIATCEAVGGRIMDRLGYRRDRVRRSAILSVWHVARYSGPEFVIRLIRRFRLGGLRFGIEVAGGYLRRAGRLVGRGRPR